MAENQPTNDAMWETARKLVLLVVLIFICWSIFRNQDEPATPQQKTTVENDVKPVPEEVKDPAYADVALIDFKLDRKKLVGRKLRLTGVYTIAGSDEMGILGEQFADNSPIMVSTKDLTRAERKMLLECKELECRVEIEGTAEEVLYDVGLTAEHVHRVK